MHRNNHTGLPTNKQSQCTGRLLIRVATAAVVSMRIFLVAATLAIILLGGLASASADEAAEKAELTKQLWPKTRIEAAIAAVEKQRRDGLISDHAYRRRMQMLEQRKAGEYVSQSLSVTNPPLNFIQNAGFEKINRNSARNRSRWLWWGGWSWGGDYENFWEDRPEYVHSGDCQPCPGPRVTS